VINSPPDIEGTLTEAELISLLAAEESDEDEEDDSGDDVAR
jgi:hypothetical protein